MDAIRRLDWRLKLVHLKDVEAAGAEHNVPLGSGIAKIPEVMRELKAIQFRQLVAIEFEKDSNDTEDMRDQIAYARRLNVMGSLTGISRTLLGIDDTAKTQRA